MAKSLFISYDGLTDPLGQSQILPYLTGLSKCGHQISILSCEKPERYLRNRNIIEETCAIHQVKWTPLFFHTKPPILAKYYDLHRLTLTASRLHQKEHFDIIHCRSYLSADIGMKLKKRYGVKYLFDMRGFWVDERVDGGLWNMGSPFYRLAYKKWKQKEARFIEYADHIISLTEAGKKEIQSWPSFSDTPITVIPCSADMELFSLSDEEQKRTARKLLQINEDAFVLSYLGSLGTWYLLDEMLLLFKVIKENYSGAKFLILTPDDDEKVYQRAAQIGLDENDFVIRFVQRKDVPELVKASDVSVSFIKPAYSKIASSPTKVGELLAMGIPVICNAIGDVAQIVSKTNGGVIVNGFNRADLQTAIDCICSNPYEQRFNRRYVEEYYNLKIAIDKYHCVYENLMTKSNVFL